MENHSRPMGEEQALRPEPCFRSKLTALLPATDMSKRTVLLRSHCSMHMDEVGERVQLSWPQGHAPCAQDGHGQRAEAGEGAAQVGRRPCSEAALPQPPINILCLRFPFISPAWMVWLHALSSAFQGWLSLLSWKHF